MSDTTTYPGWNAFWPVVGTSLLILAGLIVASDAPTLVIRGLGTRSMQWVGRLSYSWYLWHWPFIVLTVLALNNDGAPIKTLAAVTSLGVAWVAFNWVESPFRFHRWLLPSPWRTYLAGLIITAVVLGTAGGAWLLASRSTPTSFTRAKDAAFKDFFAVCKTLSTPEGTRYCAGGDLQSPTVVALVGDSHAGTWFNALSTVGLRQHVKVAGFFQPGCPFIPVAVRPLPNGPIDTSQCLTRRQEGMRLLSELKPRVVVLSQHDGQYLGLILDHNGVVPSSPEQVALWRSAMSQFLNEMDSDGIQPAVILDNPTLPYITDECVSRTGSIAACEPTRQTALAPARPLVSADRAAISGHKSPVPVLAPDDFLCNQAGCPLELDNQLIYADTNHLLYGATKLMEPRLSAMLQAALRIRH